MRANEILSEISFGGKIPGLDEPILGQGSGAVVPGGAAMPAAANAAAATRAARQAQATQAAQSQMVPRPADPKVTFEPRTPAVWRRPEGRTAGGFDPSKPTSAQSDVEKAKQFFGHNVDSTLVRAYNKMRTSGQIPPQYSQTPSDAAKAADARKTLGARVAGTTLGGAVAGAGGGAAVGIVAQKDQAARDMSTATPPPNDAWQAQPALGQAAASKAAADELKKAPPRDPTQIDELAPAVIPYLAGLGAAGLAGTAAYQAAKPSKPASVQPSSTAAIPTATTAVPAARPAAAATPAPATTTRPAAATSRPAAATSRPAGGPQQGVVGSQLAKLSGGEFATRADRLNQSKVDAILGSGYKAGTAAANLALRDYYRQQAMRADMENRSQATARGATVSPTGGVKPTEPLQRIEISAPERDNSAGSTSGGDSAPWNTVVPASSSSGGSASGTPVKSGAGLTWTDSSGNPIVTVPEGQNSLMRLMKLSGQRH